MQRDRQTCEAWSPQASPPGVRPCSLWIPWLEIIFIPSDFPKHFLLLSLLTLKNFSIIFTYVAHLPHEIFMSDLFAFIFVSPITLCKVPVRYWSVAGYYLSALDTHD